MSDSMHIACPHCLSAVRPLKKVRSAMHSVPNHTIFDEIRSELQKLWNLCFPHKERHL